MGKKMIIASIPILLKTFYSQKPPLTTKDFYNLKDNAKYTLLDFWKLTTSKQSYLLFPSSSQSYPYFFSNIINPLELKHFLRTVKLQAQLISSSKQQMVIRIFKIY